jgi:sodium-dependent dicarboxylate transporter 2/3/5
VSKPRWRLPTCLAVVLFAALVFSVTAFVPWHADALIRRATAIVLASLILWISEAAPLGVTGLLIPVAATLAGVLKWPEALAAWGDPILFLFLGAFLLARALEKHGVFNFLVQARWAQRFRGGHGIRLALGIMAVAGLVSTVQSNTAVAAMMLPVVVALARTVRNPGIVLLGLSYGATFGGMATPVGTPPNFIGYAAMKQHEAAVSFLSWMRVGVPVWFGTTLLAWGVFSLAGLWLRRVAGKGAPARTDPGPAAAADLIEPDGAAEDLELGDRRALSPTPRTQRLARCWALAAFGMTVVVWLSSGVITSLTETTHPLHTWAQRYLPESLVPILAAGVLFVVRVGPQRAPVLDRRDFRALDWDTLFLIAGGLCLGRILQSSGAAGLLAATVGQAHVSPLLLMFGLGGVTVLLSELTSNTATASLMVPIAASLAPAVGLSPGHTTWLVALCASLGFALPVSTPPNAIVYGTRLVPLRLMIVLGIAVDISSLIWVVQCVRWLA